MDWQPGKDVMQLCLVLFGALEIAAFACGIVATIAPAGKTALAISAVALVLGGFVVLL